MHVRLSRFAGLDAERIDDMVKEFESEGLTSLEGQKGFKGITVAVNQASGQAFAMSLWETEEDLRQSERTAEEAREQAIATAGPSRAPIVDRYEVVVQR
jgi:heme-degrading monooxygenase HmoA